MIKINNEDVIKTLSTKIMNNIVLKENKKNHLFVSHTRCIFLYIKKDFFSVIILYAFMHRSSDCNGTIMDCYCEILLKGS